jgi:hypothetical protein
MQKQAQELMGPTVQKRLDTTWKDNGEKPNDMIQFLIDSAPDGERTMPKIVERMMALNMASIHTTATVSIHISYARLRLVNNLLTLVLLRRSSQQYTLSPRSRRNTSLL